jgi:hypothetical protein
MLPNGAEARKQRTVILLSDCGFFCVGWLIGQIDHVLSHQAGDAGPA